MADPSNAPQNDPQNTPQFDPEAPHHTRPKLRPIQGFAAKAGEQPVLGLRDAQQVSERVVFTGQIAQFLLPSMDGSHTIDEIISDASSRASQAGAPQQALDAFTKDSTQRLVAQLDDAGLLEGPRFESMLDDMRKQFDSSDVLPPGPTANFADAIVNHTTKQQEARDATDEEKASKGAAMMRDQIERWMNQALEPVSDPSFNKLPRAVIAPHTEYSRGWLNFAHTYGRMRVCDAPDRIVILGVNHTGRGAGVVGCDKGFRTPLGTCNRDEALEAALAEALGAENTEKYYAEKYDHERESSVELQLPWLQHAFGDAAEEPEADRDTFPKVHAALIYDLTANNGEPKDESGLALETYVNALRTALEKVGGTTLVVAAAELSHVGKAFGDQQPLAGDDDQAKAFREKVITHDREMLKHLEAGKADELLTAFAWNGNWSRWTGLGPLVAVLRLLEPEHVRLLNYAAAADNQGMAMISSLAAAID